MAWTGLFNRKKKEEEKRVSHPASYYFLNRDSDDIEFEPGSAMDVHNKLNRNFYSWKAMQPRWTNQRELVKEKRGTIDRVLGSIGNTSIVEGLYNLTDGDDETTFMQGIKSGLKHQNPFTADVSERRTFSDVLKNLGWEDNDPEKISGSDVGRGIVGFAGDVLLDPITYLNPFSAAAKIARGSGVTKEGLKALKVAGVIDDASDLTKAGKKNFEKMHSLTFDEAKKVVRSTGTNANLSDELLNAQTEKFLQNYAKNIERIPDLDDMNGLTFGFISSQKKAKDKMGMTLGKELVSSKGLAKLGDNTIAPAYNSLTKKMRVSSLGQKFSTKNQIEALGVTKGSNIAFKNWYVDEYQKAFNKIAQDIDVMKDADAIKNWWETLSEDQQYDWLLSYQTGGIEDANAFTTFKAKLADKLGKEMNVDDIFSNSTNKANFEKQIKEVTGQLNKFIESKKSELLIPNKKKVEFVFGKTVEEMSDYELVTAMRYISKVKGGGYRDLMNHYNKSASRYSDIKSKIGDYISETDAQKAFVDLDNEKKSILINEYYTGKNIIDERAGLEIADMFSDLNKVDELLGGEVMPDISYIKRELDSIKSGMDKVGKYDDESLAIGKLIGTRMEEFAEREVSRGLLTRAQADALKGKYLPHYSTRDIKKIEDWMRNTGEFNPKAFGKAKKFDISKGEHKTILDANTFADEDGVLELVDAADRLYKDSLHEIFLARGLGSNRLIFNTDANNFVKYNFGKPISSLDLPEHGYEVVIPYEELKAGIKGHAKKFVQEENNKVIKSIKDPSDKKKAIESMRMNSTDWALNKEKEIYNSLFVNKEQREMFSQNITMQKLNDKQRVIVESLDLEPFQIQSSILERTNKLSKAQKVELTGSMLNLFDKVQTIWKLNNTVATPGFHTQNMYSNAFQSFLGTGADALNLSKINKARVILQTKDPKQFVTLGGKKYSYRDLHHLAKETGVVTDMFHEFEFAAGTKRGALSKIGLPKSLDPTDTVDFIPYKLGTKAGTSIEATQRMNLFMSRLDKGDTIQEAVENVNQFLFDYSALTDFEQNVMKRIIPFYTYMRKNVPMELTAMLNQPTTFTTLRRAQTNFEQLRPDLYQAEHDRNDWRQDDLQFPFEIGGKSFGMTNSLPYTQLERVLEPNKLAGQTTPALKVPIELALGRSLYTKMDIEDKGEYFMNMFANPKALNIANKKGGEWSDPISAKNMYIYGQLLGAPINEMKQIYSYPNWR